MGCGGSVATPPAEILATPGDEPCSFIVKKPMFSSDYGVYTGDGEEKKWLYIDNKSSWSATHCDFTLKSYTDETIDHVVVEGCHPDVKREVEWEQDSDDSDCSVDDLFDSDEEIEVKVKLKWKVKREAKFIDLDGKEFARMSVKVKGKTKAKLEIENPGEEHEEQKMKSSTKVKKVFYKIEWEGQDVALEFENGRWNDWDRTWKCDFFDAEYDAKFGTDVVRVQTKGNKLAADGLVVAFAVAYFFHPSSYSEQMDSKARQDAREIMNRAKEMLS